MAARLTDAERFQRDVLKALGTKTKPRKMKEIAEKLGMLTTEGDRTFVSSNNSSKIRKAIALHRKAKKAGSVGARSTMAYFKI